MRRACRCAKMMVCLASEVNVWSLTSLGLIDVWA